MSSNHLKDNRRHNVVTASQGYDIIDKQVPKWEEYTLLSPPFQGNMMTAYGNQFESTALSAMEVYLDEICKEGNEFHVHPSEPIGASVDGWIYDPEIDMDIGIELKCPYTQKIYPKIPDRYWYQVQLQCFTHGTPYGWFGVWTPEEFHAEKIVYDQEFIDWYLPYAHQFLEYVETNTKPSRWKKKPVYQPKEK